MSPERQRERDGLMREALRSISERDFPRAVEILAPAAIRHPRSATIHRFLGLAYLRQGQIPEAAHALREVIQINPRDYAAHEWFGEACGQAGRTEAAIDMLNRALALLTERIAAAFTEASRAIECRSIPDAVTTMHKASQLRLRHAEVQNRLEAVYYAAGLTELAFDHWKRELGLAPGRPRHAAGEQGAGAPDPGGAACPSLPAEKESTP